MGNLDSRPERIPAPHRRPERIPAPLPGNGRTNLNRASNGVETPQVRETLANHIHGRGEVQPPPPVPQHLGLATAGRVRAAPTQAEASGSVIGCGSYHSPDLGAEPPVAKTLPRPPERDAVVGGGEGRSPPPRRDPRKDTRPGPSLGAPQYEYHMGGGRGQAPDTCACGRNETRHRRAGPALFLSARWVDRGTQGASIRPSPSEPDLRYAGVEVDGRVTGGLELSRKLRSHNMWMDTPRPPHQAQAGTPRQPGTARRGRARASPTLHPPWQAMGIQKGGEASRQARQEGRRKPPRPIIPPMAG